jgi:hypothetical protein
MTGVCCLDHGCGGRLPRFPVSGYGEVQLVPKCSSEPQCLCVFNTRELLEAGNGRNHEWQDQAGFG